MRIHFVVKLLVAMGVTAVSTGCIDEITSPACNPVTLTARETHGDTVILNTNLRLIEGAQGQGLPIAWCGAIAVHYTEYLLDGTKLESSRDADAPLIFTPGLGDLIDGFEQGVIGMRAEGTRRLIVPPSLAYGNEVRRDRAGNVVVPANSTLVYDIEVLTVTQPQ
jgi:peptidylprolyl isomerase